MVGWGLIDQAATCGSRMYNHERMVCVFSIKSGYFYIKMKEIIALAYTQAV